MRSTARLTWLDLFLADLGLAAAAHANAALLALVFALAEIVARRRAVRHPGRPGAPIDRLQQCFIDLEFGRLFVRTRAFRGLDHAGFGRRARSSRDRRGG